MGYLKFLLGLYKIWSIELPGLENILWAYSDGS